jgi:hypothetical protein
VAEFAITPEEHRLIINSPKIRSPLDFNGWRCKAAPRRSLVRTPIVLEPPIRVAAFRIAVRPMDDAPLRVPLEFAAKLDRVAQFERFHSARQIDVVCHQQFLPGSQLEDEFLVPNSLVIFRQEPDDSACALNLHIPLVILKRRRQHPIGVPGGIDGVTLLRRRPEAILNTAEVGHNQQQNDQSKLFQVVCSEHRFSR